MSAMGLNGPATLIISGIAAVIGAAATFHLFGRKLENEDEPPEPKPEHAKVDSGKGVIDLINAAGKEAFTIAVGSLPMLVLSLLLVNILRTIGAIEFIESLSAPLLALFDLPPAAALAVITKAIAGGTAMMGISSDMLQQGLLSTLDINRVAGLLIHPFDLVGITIMISAGPRVASVLRPAICGAVVAILLRAAIHLLVW